MSIPNNSIVSYYKVFNPDFFTLVPNNEMLVATLNKISDTELQITGETTPYSDEIELTWFCRDDINHGYIKHNIDKNFEGRVIEFNLGNGINIIPYNDKKYVQKLKIKSALQEEVAIPIINFSTQVSGRVTVSRRSTIDLNVGYIVEKSVDLTYTTDNSLETAKEGEDYVVNYEKGYVTLISNKIPFSSTVSISFKYYSGIDFKIEFDKLKMDISNIDYISIPIKIDKTKGEGRDFLYSINSIKTENCEMSPIPSNLKINDINLCEDFRYVRNYSSNLICKTVDKLGFKREIVVNIGNGDFGNITGADALFKRFNKGFLDWYSQICKSAKLKGMTNIKVIIPFENKYLNKKYFQKTKGRKYLSKLNPIHPFVVTYYKAIVEQLIEITKDLSLSIAFEDFNYSMDSNGNLGVFDEYTMDLFKKENPDRIYLGKGSLSEYEKMTVDSDLKTGKWLSEKLKVAFMDISKIKKADIIIADSAICKESFFEYINSINVNWSASFNTIHIKHSNFEEEAYNYIDRIDFVKKRFEIDFTKIGYYIYLDDYFSTKNIFRFNYYKKVLKAIDELQNIIGIKNITMGTGFTIRGDSILLYKMVPYVELNKVEHEIDIALCKANKETMCYLPNTIITSVKRVVDDVDEITLEVPYYVMDRFEHRKIKNYFYDDIKPERLLRVNEKEYFVIKTVKESIENKTVKEVVALSLEHKLSKRTVVLEDSVMQLYSQPSSEGDTLGIFNLLESETGWGIGYIDTEVQFELVEGVQKAKVRWFQTIDESWYKFLTDTVSTSFDCLIQFDTLNKRVNVFKNTHIGDDRGLYLTEDNYIKSLAITDSTNDIVTRLTCVGKDEMGIHSVNITGQGYIDNFSYFIENGDLSSDLVIALDKYEKAMKKLHSQWDILSTSRFNKNKTLREHKKNLTTIVGDINALKAIKESYEQAGDQANANRIQLEIDAKVVSKLDLESKITQLESEIKILDADLNKTNEQLNPVNTVDEFGKKIFNKVLLDERQEFIYHDVWADDTYLDEKVLLESGMQQLDYLCKPTTDYSIDVVNFLERIGKRKGFNGELFLRDIVMLKTEYSSKEIELYLVGYEYSPKEKTLSLALSNKFKTVNGTKLLGDLLSESKRISRTVKIKKHLWQKIKEME